MKIEGGLFAAGTVFYFITAAVYWFMSHDEAGTTGLALTGGLAFLVAFYILYTSKRVYPRPEDRVDGDIDDADPDYGFFSPHSWMPLFVAIPVAIIAFGLVFAAWMVVLGVVWLLIAVAGWLFEYYGDPYEA